MCFVDFLAEGTLKNPPAGQTIGFHSPAEQNEADFAPKRRAGEWIPTTLRKP
jgi:hypothetical protein